ncbi:hypothetical protein GP486_006647, partial [Trichoglossum hirsutum]
IGSLLEKELDCSLVPALCGPRERRPTGSIFGLQIGSFLEKQLDDFFRTDSSSEE